MNYPYHEEAVIRMVKKTLLWKTAKIRQVEKKGQRDKDTEN